MKAQIIIGGLAGALLIATGALAHHSVSAQFDVGKTVEMTGTLEKFENINPHSQWTFQVKNTAGVTEQWKIESLAPAALRRVGVKLKEDIVPGRVYEFSIAPPRQNNKNGLLRTITINGTKFQIAQN